MGEVALNDIEVRYNGTVACSEVSLAVREGEFFTFLGPSGCGKTTILRLIAGFIQPWKGTIRLGGRDITLVPAEKRKVGMVFQNYALFPFLSVYRNIEYGLDIQKRPAGEIRSTVARYMEMIGLSGFEDRRISELSGGEQQRVALARSLAVEPKVLLLDEPLSNLDARLRDKMRLEIKSLQKQLGITTIFVTHDQTEALTLSDRIAVFDRGRIVQTGTPEALYAAPNCAFVARFIGDTNLFEAEFSQGTAAISGGLTIRLNQSRQPGRFISIRPQDIALSETDPGRPNSFKGRLAERQFNGAWIDYLVQVNGTVFRVAVMNTTGNTPNIRPGDEVFIALPENGIHILDR